MVKSHTFLFATHIKLAILMYALVYIIVFAFMYEVKFAYYPSNIHLFSIKYHLKIEKSHLLMIFGALCDILVKIILLLRSTSLYETEGIAMKNKLFKILFVDDEITVLRGMTAGYDWETLGFEVAGEAMDAESALQIAKNEQVDVVITDVCMDDTDGLTLLSELKKLSPSPEVIILSGYPHFEYAQSALEKGAFAYLLKPLRNSELLSTLERVKAKIKTNLWQPRALFLSHILRVAMPTPEDIESLASEYKVSLPEGSFFICSIQISSELDSPADAVYSQLFDYLKENFTDIKRIFICKKSGNQPHIIALIYCSSFYVKTVLCSQIDTLRKNYTEETGISLTIGVSQLYSATDSIRDAYLESLFAVQHTDASSQNSIFHFDAQTAKLSKDSFSTATSLSFTELNQVITGIQTLNRGLVNQVLEGYFSRIRALKYRNQYLLKSTVTELAIQIIASLSLPTERLVSVFNRQPHPVIDILPMNRLVDMENYINSLVENIFNHAGHLNSTSGYSLLTKKVMTYIYLNYPAPISLDTIAEELGHSKNHLMRIFKQETNWSINDFLIKHRLSVACVFLKSTDLSIAEVATNVGYLDSSYFSKVFKKEIGLLPSEYRDQRQERI